jgi:hypothetical protein
VKPQLSASLPALTVPAVASALPTDADIELKQLGDRLLQEKEHLNGLFDSPDPDEKEIDAASGRIAALMPPIFGQTATTRDGLAVQAAAAAIACRELWDHVGDWSTSDHPSWEVERPFIEAVCRHTGVTHPVVPSERRNAALDHPSESTLRSRHDPIFAAIEAFKPAASEADDRARAAADVAWSDPAAKAIDQAFESAAKERAVKRDALLTTIPTTTEGLAALNLHRRKRLFPSAFQGGRRHV